MHLDIKYTSGTYLHTCICTESFQEAKTRVAEEKEREHEKAILSAPIAEPMEGLVKAWSNLSDPVRVYLVQPLAELVCLCLVQSFDSNGPADPVHLSLININTV